MKEIHPLKMITFGFVLVLFGFIAPFLMMLRILPPSFMLSFLSFGASVAGLMLGMVGAALYIRKGR